MSLLPLAPTMRPLLSRYTTFTRSFHYTFERVQKPPLQEPRESPYIVGPYLKPKYLPVKYITDAIKAREDNDLNYFIYKPTKIELDESRTVRLLLIQDVEGLGVAGQVIDTSYRHGASKLVAMKKAEYATDFALKWYKFGPRTMDSASSALSPRTARLLRTKIYELPIKREVTIEPWHLSLALRLGGCACPIEAIDRDSISDYQDDQDQTQVKCIVRINNHERVEVRFAYINLVKDD